MIPDEFDALVARLEVAAAEATGAPEWAVAGAVALLEAAVQLFEAKTDTQREDAVMTAAEAAKKAADDAKFGPKS